MLHGCPAITYRKDRVLSKRSTQDGVLPDAIQEIQLATAAQV